MAEDQFTAKDAVCRGSARTLAVSALTFRRPNADKKPMFDARGLAAIVALALTAQTERALAMPIYECMSQSLTPKLLQVTSAPSGERPAPLLPGFLAKLWTQAKDLPLPAWAEAEVSAHAGLARLSAATDGGSGLVFRFSPAVAPGNTVPGMLMGETIQAAALRQVIASRFPKATIAFDGNVEAAAGKTVVQIRPTDSIELREGGPAVDRGPTLEMAALKQGNPVNCSISRPAARAALGLVQGDRAVHLYVSAPMFVPGVTPDLSSVISQVRANARARTVFLSVGMSTHVVRAFEIRPEIRGQFSRVVMLSELKQGESIVARPGQAPVLVINDVSGYKPYLDAASQLSVVVGPINHAEALSVGTPVISMNSASTMGGYDWNAFRSERAQFVRSGLVVPVERIADLGRAIERVPETFSTQQPQPERWLRPAFRRVLDHVSTYITDVLAGY